MKPLNNRIIARHVVKFSFYFAAKFLSQQFPRQQADYSQREISSFAKITILFPHYKYALMLYKQKRLNVAYSSHIFSQFLKFDSTTVNANKNFIHAPPTCLSKIPIWRE